jgi:serine protease Do
MKKTSLIFVLPLIVVFSCSQSGKPSQGHSKAVGTVRDMSSYDIKDDMGNTREGLQWLYEKHKDAVFSVYTSDGKGDVKGSGFLISENGIAVSNYHVFAQVSPVEEEIRLKDGREYRVAEVLSFSKELDYVVFKLKTDSSEVFPFLSVGEKALQIGQSVFALGGQDRMGKSTSTGIVSLLKKEEHLIQTTAKITPRNGGGPLLNKEGLVVGITLPSLARGKLNFVIDIRILHLK